MISVRNVLVVLAVGQAVVVITRNVDLSVGSVLGLTAYLTGRLFLDAPDLPIAVVALVAVAAGVLVERGAGERGLARGHRDVGGGLGEQDGEQGSGADFGVCPVIVEGEGGGLLGNAGNDAACGHAARLAGGVPLGVLNAVVLDDGRSAGLAQQRGGLP